MVDLPGTYSLTANSVEEQIARDYLVKEKPDLVVALLNAASLERNLYLVAELIELAPRLVIALNMTDVAQQEGTKIDFKTLEAALNMPVVPMVASQNQGVKDLVEVIVQKCAATGEMSAKSKHIESGSQTEGDIAHIAQLLTDEDTSSLSQALGGYEDTRGRRADQQALRSAYLTTAGRRLIHFLRTRSLLP